MASEDLVLRTTIILFMVLFCILILSLTEPGYNELQLNGKNNLISTFEFQKNNIMRMSVMTEC